MSCITSAQSPLSRPLVWSRPDQPIDQTQPCSPIQQQGNGVLFCYMPGEGTQTWENNRSFYHIIESHSQDHPKFLFHLLRIISHLAWCHCCSFPLNISSKTSFQSISITTKFIWILIMFHFHHNNNFLTSDLSPHLVLFPFTLYLPPERCRVFEWLPSPSLETLFPDCDLS